jgi:subtilisin-like proprotein convertase family protein
MNRVRIAAATRRAVLILPVAALAVGLAVTEPLAAAGAKPKRPKSAVVTRTFTQPAAITIAESGAAAPYPSVVKVSGLKKGRLVDVDLELTGLAHSYPDDLDVLLVAPDGRNAVVLSDVGSNNVIADISLALDDEATTPLPDIARLTTGRFGPTNIVETGFPDGFAPPAPSPSSTVALSTFDGIDPNGAWSLFVFDDSAGDAGVVASGWALTIEARVKQGKGKGHNGGKGKGKAAKTARTPSGPTPRRGSVR